LFLKFATTTLTNSDSHQLVGYKQGAAQLFADYLTTVCESKPIDFIAEELNEESIVLWKAKESTARLLATQRAIPHRFSDPNSKQRKKLGIRSYEELREKHGFGRCPTVEQSALLEEEERKTWPIRENFWLDTIRSLPYRHCLFIIGKNHVKSFANLSSSQTFTVEIVNGNWEP